MTRRLFFIPMLAIACVSVAGIVSDPICAPERLSPDGRQYQRVICEIKTDDIGDMTFVVVSTEAVIRANADGTVRAADIPGIQEALRAKYRAYEAEYRAVLASWEEEKDARRRRRAIINRAGVE